MKKFAYPVQPDEPSIFTSNEMGVANEWLCWFIQKVEKARGREVDDIEDIKPSKQSVQLGFDLMVRLRQMINIDEWDLAPEPPPMFLPKGKGYISQAWVIDTCRRDGMGPHEAIALATALSKQQKDYDRAR